MPRTISLSSLDLTEFLRRGDTCCWGQAQAEPTPLVEKLLEQQGAIGELRAFIGMGWTDAVTPGNSRGIDFISYCGTGANRHLHSAGMLDVLPVHYSQFEAALSGLVDVLFLQLAPGRTPGSLSLGLACEYLWPLVKSARLVIAEVNDRAPSTPALVELSLDDIDILVPTSRPIPDPPPSVPDMVHAAIGRHVAQLVPEGATLQIGVGAIPAGVLDALQDHRHLGVHTGMFVDGLARLIELGAVDNSRKRIDTGYSVTGLVAGNARTRALCSETDLIRLAPTSYTHSQRVLASVGAFTSINSALEVDLSGQVNAEMSGNRYVGAVGGGTDFARGAAAAEDGLPIIALPAARRDRNGTVHSNIVPALSGPVSIGRADAGLIVTEYGSADLRGASLRQRAERLLRIAAPDLRDDLERRAGLTSRPR